MTVACLLDLWLWKAQVRSDPIGATRNVQEWHEVMDKSHYDTYGLSEVEGTQAGGSVTEDEEEKLLAQEKNPPRAEWMRLCAHPGQEPDEHMLKARLV